MSRSELFEKEKNRYRIAGAIVGLLIAAVVSSSLKFDFAGFVAAAIVNGFAFSELARIVYKVKEAKAEWPLDTESRERQMMTGPDYKSPSYLRNELDHDPLDEDERDWDDNDLD